MASSFKYLTEDKFSVVSTKLHEVVPLTGSVLSSSAYTDLNIENFSHQRYQSVYDYPYASSSANKLVDITVGYSSNSNFSGANNTQNAEKIQMYNHLAQVCMGYDVTGSIIQFDQDGNTVAGGTKHKECVFLCFDRLLVKDGIKKGSFTITFYTGNTYIAPHGQLTITDTHATSSYFVNSAVGEWSYLTGVADIPNGGGGICGAIFYNAGIIVLTGSIFTGTGTTVFHTSTQTFARTFDQTVTGTSVTSSCDAIRRRWKTCQFNNTTELSSQLIFIDVGANEFNYSSNPTYLSASKIRVKNDQTDPPIAYITELGLYAADGELLASGKISTPLRSSNQTQMSIRARLDY